LAMRDLEIRGSGDILGTQQSGHLSQIGFHLYCKLLKKAMHALKTKKSTSFIETKLEFPFNAQLPTTYIPETSLRLEIYHRLGDATADTEVEKITSELIDRFGKPPIETEWLLALTHIRIQANAQNYTLLKFTSKNLYTEQQRGSKLLKTTHPLPPITSPKTLLTSVSGLYHAIQRNLA
ncbi:MAG: transcription-repair coupling factor, partial [Chlamydiia bacterium]|nr:transcription-repair coupling factor [Chlamydiia bacterium]